MILLFNHQTTTFDNVKMSDFIEALKDREVESIGIVFFSEDDMLLIHGHIGDTISEFVIKAHSIITVYDMLNAINTELSNIPSFITILQSTFKKVSMINSLSTGIKYLCFAGEEN